MAELTPKPKWAQNYQRFPEAVLMIVLGGPFLFGGFEFIEWLQEAQCSWDSFLTGGLHPTTQFALLMAAIAAWYGIARHLLLHKSDVLRRWMKVELTCDRRWHEQWGGVALMLLVASLVVFYMVTSSQYCLTLYAIKYRPILGNALTVHDWKDISEIDVTCHRGSKNRTVWTYDLVSRDGLRLDISESNEGMYWAYPYLQQVLAGNKFRFDTSGVTADCPMSRQDPALLRP